MSTNEHGEHEETPSGGAQRCAFPGCTRAVPERPGKGRPPRYCGQTVLGTEHNRANALTRRRQMERLGVDAGRAESEPVTVARATAGDLVTRLESAVREQSDLQTALLAALRTMDSPVAAAAQASAATESARADAARAHAEVAAAAVRMEEAEQAAAQALADAEDADVDAAAARAEAAAAQQDLQVEQAAHAETRTELDAQIEATGEQTVRAEQAEDEAERLDQALRAEQAAHTQTRTDLDAVRTAAETAAAVAGERERSLTAHAVQLTTDLGASRAQIERLHADVRAADAIAQQQSARAEHAETEQARLAQALQTEQTAHTQARTDLDTVRADLAQARQDTAAATAATTHLRTQLEQLTADLATARAHAADTAQAAAGLQAELAAARAELAAADRASRIAEDHSAARISDLRSEIETLRAERGQ